MKLIRAFVFATRIVQSLYFLNTKFQASSHLVWLGNPVCVGPGRKPGRPVFSHRGSYIYRTFHMQTLLNSSCLLCSLHYQKVKNVYHFQSCLVHPILICNILASIFVSTNKAASMSAICVYFQSSVKLDKNRILFELLHDNSNDKRRLNSVWTSTQSDQSLRFCPIGTYNGYNVAFFMRTDMADLR